MSLALSISPSSEIPIYRQIVQHIRRSIASRHLALGEQLPSVRALAESLVVNPNTVARAYQELMRDGLIESHSGVGVFVSERREIFSEEERKRRLGHALVQLVDEALILGLPLPEVQDALRREWRRLEKPDGNAPERNKK